MGTISHRWGAAMNLAFMSWVYPEWDLPRIDDADYRCIHEDVRHVHLHDEVLDPGFARIEEMMRTFRVGGYTGAFSLEIIREDPLEAKELRSVGDRLREYFDA